MRIPSPREILGVTIVNTTMLGALLQSNAGGQNGNRSFSHQRAVSTASPRKNINVGETGLFAEQQVKE